MIDLAVVNREAVADWIEASVLARESYIGFDALESVSRSELGISEATFAFALSVISRRRGLLGDFYPFNVSSVSISPRERAELYPYSLLSLISPDSPGRTLCNQGAIEEMGVVFERLVVQAMRCLLGPTSVALRFGWPSDDGRPQGFYEAIEWLATKMGIKPGRAYRPPRRRDGGVDVIAWRPFRDGKSGFPVFLVQCTVQKELLSKSFDIDVRNWAGWLTLDSDPGTVLAVPGTIASTQLWNDIAIRTLILDRIRISELLGEASLKDTAGAGKFVSSTLTLLRDSLQIMEV